MVLLPHQAGASLPHQAGVSLPHQLGASLPHQAGVSLLLQTGASPIAVLGTLVLFSLGLAVTAHVAARNVIGDAEPKRALLVGPWPAIVSVVGGTMMLPAAATLPVAIALDAAAIRWAYGGSPRRTALITIVHFTVTVLVTLIVFVVSIIWASRPT